MNTLKTQYETEFYGKTKFVPRSKYLFSSYMKTSQLMLYSEIIAVCSQIHTKHTNTLCGQNAEILCVFFRAFYTLMNNYVTPTNANIY
jgi:hypothetical protein